MLLCTLEHRPVFVPAADLVLHHCKSSATARLHWGLMSAAFYCPIPDCHTVFCAAHCSRSASG
jgi:hypothetical protein